MRTLISFAAAAALALGATACSDADEAEGAGEGDTLVLYTARHYDSDYALYEAFTKETGIEIEVVEADGDLLIERVKADGESNPPDVIVTVDAGRLWRAEQEGLFQPFESETLTANVPAGMRDPNGNWYGLASRARVIVYAEDRVDEGELEGYESLADPAFEGRICARSSGNIYNISLLSALIERWGEERASEWATAVANNLAREPQGGDSDQIDAGAAARRRTTRPRSTACRSSGRRLAKVCTSTSREPVSVPMPATASWPSASSNSRFRPKHSACSPS